MEIKPNKFNIILIYVIISSFNLVNGEKVKKIYYLFINYYIIQLESKIFKGLLRKLWDEEVPFDKNSISDKNERDDLVHCERSDFKYFIYYISGEPYNFTEIKNINFDDAVIKNK